MFLVVFRSRLREGVEAEVTHLGAKMYALASAMPGFVSYKDFVAEDGENVALVEYENLESVAAWRDHPEHKEAQQRGRSEFFAEYTIHICSITRSATSAA